VSVTVSRANGRRPVIISHSTTPNAQMSDRLSTGRPQACSGLMYAPVPRITPCVVITGESIVGEFIASATPTAATSIAISSEPRRVPGSSRMSVCAAIMAARRRQLSMMLVSRSPTGPRVFPRAGDFSPRL
jgi:hypothetical protein